MKEDIQLILELLGTFSLVVLAAFVISVILGII